MDSLVFLVIREFGFWIDCDAIALPLYFVFVRVLLHYLSAITTEVARYKGEINYILCNCIPRN